MCAAILEVTYATEVVLVKIASDEDLELRLATLQTQPTVVKIRVFNPGKKYTRTQVWQED